MQLPSGTLGVFQFALIRLVAIQLGVPAEQRPFADSYAKINIKNETLPDIETNAAVEEVRGISWCRNGGALRIQRSVLLQCKRMRSHSSSPSLRSNRSKQLLHGSLAVAYDSGAYRTVLRLIAANPYHAVRSSEVHAALEKVGIKTGNARAAQVLLSMVEYNVVSLRPYSNMAKDIPREAFLKQVGSKEKEDSVVTMPSPAHLAAVLKLDVELEEKPEESETAQDTKGDIQENT
jgi:hypothetical protein